MADAPYSQTIAYLTRESYQNSAGHGFWDTPETDETTGNKMMLVVSEIAEAFESFRDPKADDMVKVPRHVVEALLNEGDPEGGDDGSVEAFERHSDALIELTTIYEKWMDKPRGLDIELADALIRIFDFAGRKGIDLDHALRRKMEYNQGREFMHGRRV